MAETRESLIIEDGFTSPLQSFIGLLGNLRSTLDSSNFIIGRYVTDTINGFSDIEGRLRNIDDVFRQINDNTFAINFPLEHWLEDISELNKNYLQLNNTTEELVNKGYLTSDALDYEERVLNRLNRTVIGANSAHNDFENSLDSVNTSANRLANGGLNNLVKQIARYGTALLGVRSFGSLLGSGLSTSRYEVIYQTRSQADEYGSALYDWVNKSAIALGRPTDELLKATNDFLSLTTSPQNLSRLTESANRLALISENDDFNSLANAITQAFRTGNTRTLSTQTGISNQVFEQIGLRDAARTNDLNAYLTALENALELVGLTDEAYEKLVNDSANLWRRFTNNIRNYSKLAAQQFTNAFAPAFRRLNDWLDSDNGVKFFTQLGNALEVLGTLASYAVDGLVSLLDLIADNFETILVGAAIAAGVLAGKLALVAGTALLNNWQIIAIIGGLLLLIDTLHELGFTYEEIFGGFGTALGVTTHLVTSFVTDVLNLFSGLGFGIQTVFTNLKAGIAIIFQSIADIVIGTLETIAQAVDFLFGSNLASGVNSFRQGLRDAAYGLLDETESSKAPNRRTNRSIDDRVEQYNSLFSGFGKKLDEFDLDGLFNGLADKFPDFTGIDQIGEIGSVGRIKNNEVKLANEDYKKIVDLLVRGPIINIEVVNGSTINNEVVVNQAGEILDPQEIARVIVNDLQEEIAYQSNVVVSY